MVIAIFLAFVLFVVGLSFYLGSKTKTSKGFYAAGSEIHWAVNGIAFAGDYLSAASFLGICGLIATAGYDGFLYSIGYLAGWVVALFVIAEPMKRLGKYTFTDALDARFNSRGIKLASAISTLIISTCYLIPQMVGAGVLVEPLLGMAHHWGVIMVGAIVILIVATAGMASTTYVQFIKGSLLIVFSFVLVCAVLARGFSTRPDQGGRVPFHDYQELTARQGVLRGPGGGLEVTSVPGWKVLEVHEVKSAGATFALLSSEGREHWFMIEPQAQGQPQTSPGAPPAEIRLREVQSLVQRRDGATLINGAPASPTNKLRQVGSIERLRGDPDPPPGAVSPAAMLAAMGDPKTTVLRWKEAKLTDAGGNPVTLYFPTRTPGNLLMRPGLKFKVEGTPVEKFDFFSLMLALFLGTAALPHILVRYYTVPNPASARKSTIVAIAGIGFFYILTLFMGLGAMINGVINPVDSNMAAPLLARSFGTFMFAVISAIVFATVLGTVSGLIVAASGAVAHDLLDRFFKVRMDDRRKIRAGKISALAVGAFAIVLGILFKGMNVTFLVGLAFAVAASANLPAILMMLFWKKTTAIGITASTIVGVVSSLTLIALSPDLYKQYGLDPATAPVPFSNPGAISIPLSFATLIIVSLLTQKERAGAAELAVAAQP